MIIVADTSALISLTACDSIDLLEKLFGTIIVPVSVYNECIVKNKKFADRLKVYLFNKIVDIEDSTNLRLPIYLGKGEMDAIKLYKEKNADYLLIDDHRARKIAELNNIIIIGSIGVLLLAKKKFLEKIRNEDIYIHETLFAHALKLAGE